MHWKFTRRIERWLQRCGSRDAVCVSDLPLFLPSLQEENGFPSIYTMQVLLCPSLAQSHECQSTPGQYHSLLSTQATPSSKHSWLCLFLACVKDTWVLHIQLGLVLPSAFYLHSENPLQVLPQHTWLLAMASPRELQCDFFQATLEDSHGFFSRTIRKIVIKASIEQWLPSSPAINLTAIWGL